MGLRARCRGSRRCHDLHFCFLSGVCTKPFLSCTSSVHFGTCLLTPSFEYVPSLRAVYQYLQVTERAFFFCSSEAHRILHFLRYGQNAPYTYDEKSRHHGLLSSPKTSSGGQPNSQRWTTTRRNETVNLAFPLLTARASINEYTP